MTFIHTYVHVINQVENIQWPLPKLSVSFHQSFVSNLKLIFNMLSCNDISAVRVLFFFFFSYIYWGDESKLNQMTKETVSGPILKTHLQLNCI